MNDLPNEASPPHTDLHRGLGVIGIVFMVVAAAAPITVVAANLLLIAMGLLLLLPIGEKKILNLGWLKLRVTPEKGTQA